MTESLAIALVGYWVLIGMHCKAVSALLEISYRGFYRLTLRLLLGQWPDTSNTDWSKHGW